MIETMDTMETRDTVGTAIPGPSSRELELSAIIGAYNDVTERLKCAHEKLHAEVMRLREELGRKNAELRRRERLAALGEMAAGLAHEIRNPLGGIALSASLLESQLRDRPAAGAAAARISSGVRALERLVSGILDFSHEHELERANHGAHGLLARVADSARAWEESTGATLMEETPDSDFQVWCDRDRLVQVLLNLAMNALQAAGRGGRAWLSATLHSEGGVEFRVQDDGPGIPEADLHRIFNPFFTTKSSGTGLGLAIAHRIVESHGGGIRAGNRPQGGACFVVMLPGREQPGPGPQPRRAC